MSDCGPGCGCRGDVSRRDFLKTSAGAAGLVAIGTRAGRAAPGDIPTAAKQPPPQAWFDQLTQAGETIVYQGDQLQRLIFPLGGIGTGTFWLHGSGRLVNWQIFNNIQKDSGVDDTFFAVRIEQEGHEPVVRVLQQDDVGPFPGIKEIRFVGQYPVATVTFDDPALPVELTLEAFNPMIPLNERDSGIPCAVFTVRAKNRSDTPVRVSLLASLQNAVGHAGKGSSAGIAHPTYGGNVNQELRRDRLTGIIMRAEPGKPAELAPPIELLVDHDHLPILANDPVRGLELISVGAVKSRARLKTVYWLGEGDLRKLGGSVLQQVVTAVRERGDVLLLSGVNNPLMKRVRPSVPAETRRRETIFADFDAKNFGQWEVKGKAFTTPKAGTATNQNPVTGFLGAGLVNSFDPNDGAQGTLTSPEFTIKEKYLSFLIGGGNHPGACGANLKVDGKVVRSATGKHSEHLERVEWDVADLTDKTARLEIVDQHGADWGHVLLDDIRFSNLSIDAVTVEDAEAWNAVVDELTAAGGMKPVGLGKGKAMSVPVELAPARAGVDEIQQRDRSLKLIAELAEVTYRPAVGRAPEAPSYGTMCLATPDADATIHAGWTDRMKLFDQFLANGTLAHDDATRPGVPSSGQVVGPTEAGQTINGALCVEASAQPQASAAATFVVAWHFPNQHYPQNHWRPAGGSTVKVGTMYANWYPDAPSVAQYAVVELDRLRRETFAFRDAMFDTTLPQYFIDCVAANASILRSPTCFWTRDGTFYGFEGCNYGGGGCCPMNCNHVWNYEQTLAKLWPGLERNMRVTELRHHQQDDGGIHHRVEVPRDNPHKRHMPVADGQCGAVLKAYREHLHSPDRRFLDDHWERIRKAMDFAIATWDKDADGVMEEPQFNTYDRVIYGHNTFVSSLYLAALRAAEELARLAKDEPAAERYRGLFDRGRKKIAETLFDDEYYVQKSDNLNLGYGVGCWSDQVVGQWWARILNLGDILPNDQVQRALKAVFKHNWMWTQEGFAGTQRFLEFADGKDKGLLCGSWPKGGRPDDPILYRDEVWTGIEYQVAGHKIYEGQFDEALVIVKGARERYDGRKKSPWNEIECGDYYVRAMSSWSLLLAAQGYFHDGPAWTLAFHPRVHPDAHRSFFTTADGWGRFEQTRGDRTQTNALRFVAGRCDLKELRFGLPDEAKAVHGTAKLADRELVAEIGIEAGAAVLKLNTPTTIQAGETLTVKLDWS